MAQVAPVKRPDAQQVWEQGRASVVAELRGIVRRHHPDGRGRCAACVAVGLAYPGGHSGWPCDARIEAEAGLRRMGVDPDSEEEEEEETGGG